MTDSDFQDAPGEASADEPSAREVLPRKRSPYFVAMLVSAVAFFLIGYYWLGDLLAEKAGLNESSPTPTPESAVPESVRWVGDGLLAIQTSRDGTPVVAVVETASGIEHTAVGHVLVTHELGAPVVWTLPMTAEDWNRAGAAGELRGVWPYDSPPDRLESWDLSTPESGPSADVAAKWRRIEGPGAYDAYLEIDPLKGAHPSRLLFNNQQSSGEGHAAALPDELTTFAPIGFSSSGAYLALETLCPAGEPEDPRPQAQAAPSRDVFILEVSTGAVVATATLSDYSTFASPQWFPTRDVLVWPEPAAEDSGGALALRALAPDSDVRDAAGLLGIAIPGDWGEGTYVTLAGSGPTGIVYLEHGESVSVWHLGESGLTEMGTIPWTESASWRESDGLATIETEYDESDGTQWTVVAVYELEGTGRRVVWRSLAAEDCGT